MDQPVAAVEDDQPAFPGSKLGEQGLEIQARLETDVADLRVAGEYRLDIGHAGTVALAQRIAEHGDLEARHAAAPSRARRARMSSTRSRSAGLSTSIDASAMSMATAATSMPSRRDTSRIAWRRVAMRRR